MCFKLLGANGLDFNRPSSTPIKRIPAARQDVITILHFIWEHESSPVFCPTENL